MTLTSDQFKFFAEYIEKNLGIVYADSNAYQLEKRIKDICKSLDFKDEQALYEKAKISISGDMKQLLLDVATNNETSFFRDPKVFKAIESFVIPSLIESNSNLSSIQIWSAASSFGQEPYTLSMLFTEIGLKNVHLPKIEIAATDISAHALERSREGKYSQLEVQRGVPASYLIKYFEKDSENYWQLKPAIRSMVKFTELNLLNCAGLTKTFDLVLCRNVLIYQRDDKKKEIIKYITSKIRENGFLIMGATESLIGLSDNYKQIIHEGAVVYQKNN